MMANDIGFYVSVCGLIGCLVLAQSSRKIIASNAARFFCFANLVMFFALMARIASEVNWWAIAVFFACSLAAGFIFGSVSRSKDDSILYRTQTIQGIAVIAFTAISWHLS
ncbi:TPA: hypothetical protein KEV05_004439 [Klebsiella oxytoca]|nr:hypothetical protein [Klebsiella oxytoca]